MAVDEFLFRSFSGEDRTVIRFYQWERPTVSLGCSQNAEKAVDLELCRVNGVDVVRRITGGKLVLHHHEVTYSICSGDVDVFTANLGDSYRLISLAFIRGLERMGLQPRPAGQAPSFYSRGNLPCFSHAARDEAEVDGKKIIGSAQKRIGPRFLQHGSIPLTTDEALLKQVSRLAEQDGMRMTSLSEALGRRVNFEWAVSHLAKGISEFFGAKFKPLVFREEDLEAIGRIQRERYESRVWTLEGKG